MKKAAVAAVVRERSAGLELLLIHRADHPSDPWSGHLAFPGGRVDAADADPFAAALRESKEELDLDLSAHGELIGELSHLPARIRPLIIHPYVFALHQDAALAPDVTEVQDYFWVPLDFLLDERNRGRLTRKIAGVPVHFPCYEIDGRTLWGLTLRMTDELLSVSRKLG